MLIFKVKMGNTQHQRLFAIMTATKSTSNEPDPSSPPSYLAYSTTSGLDSSLAVLSGLEMFKIDVMGRNGYTIRNAYKEKWLTAKPVKNSRMKGLILKDDYYITDTDEQIVFTAVHCDDFIQQPNHGLLAGYLHINYQGFRSPPFIYKTYDKEGSLVIESSSVKRIINMMYHISEVAAGSIQSRKMWHTGTKGHFAENLDVKRKAGILFAAVLTCRYRDDRNH